MGLDKEVTCPDCGTVFTMGEAGIWHVCLGCGEIWPPDEEWEMHRADPTVECDSPHTVRKYSADDARRASEQFQQKEEG